MAVNDRLLFIVIDMVEYLLMLNVIRDKLEDEVWNVAKKLNHKLKKEDIHKFVNMANQCIFANGYGKTIDAALANALAAKVSSWQP